MDGKIQLDRTDFDIIRILQDNVRISNKQLAARVNLAPSTCHERVKRLWDLNVLTGAHAKADPSVLGVGISALLFLVLARHDRAEMDEFVSRIGSIPVVQSAYFITGTYDAIVHVVARDMGHLRNIVFDHFTNQPEIDRLETSILYEQIQSPVIPALHQPG